MTNLVVVPPMPTVDPSTGQVVWDASTTVWPPQGSPDASVANLADFGPAIASVDVDDAVLACLTTWMPTYLRFIERSRSLDYTLPAPLASSYMNTVSDDQFPDRTLPGIYVATARTQGQPTIVADGTYSTPWLVAVSALVRGRTPVETRRTASYYELAFRMALVQQLTRDKFAMGCRWVTGGEARPAADPSGQGRYLGEGASQFWVFTDQVVQEAVGPTVPDEEPYLPLATVESVDIEVDGVGPAGPLP